ncbi:E3 ubiquitin-protein ligase-like protein [Drosera capensis]
MSFLSDIQIFTRVKPRGQSLSSPKQNQITGAVVSAWEANDATSMHGIGRKKLGISISQFGTLRKKRGRGGGGGGGDGCCAMECCVCLCCFEAEDEVSELPCKHYFHKGCVEKWFDGGDRRSTTCPLCRMKKGAISNDDDRVKSSLEITKDFVRSTE